MKRTQARCAQARRAKEKGSALIEFALCLVLFWTPLFLGTYQIGFNLIRAVQVTQICRDAGHMYAQQADFTSPSYQNLLGKLMPTTFQPTSTGNTIIYFSTITFVDGTACYVNGLAPSAAAANTSNCPNLNKAVFVQQIPYGNNSIVMGTATAAGSVFGTPSAGIMDSQYKITPQHYLTDSSAVAKNFLNVINLSQSSEYVYMSEMYVRSNDLNFWSYIGTTGEYARSLF